MSVPLIYTAPDANEDETLWRRTEDWRQCIPIARRCDVTEAAWSLLLAGAAVANGGERAEECDVCPSPVNEDARCTHGRSLCPEHLTACPECRDEFADDQGLRR